MMYRVKDGWKWENMAESYNRLYWKNPMPYIRLKHVMTLFFAARYSIKRVKSTPSNRFMLGEVTKPWIKTVANTWQPKINIYMSNSHRYPIHRERLV